AHAGTRQPAAGSVEGEGPADPGAVRRAVPGGGRKGLDDVAEADAGVDGPGSSRFAPGLGPPGALGQARALGSARTTGRTGAVNRPRSRGTLGAIRQLGP